MSYGSKVVSGGMSAQFGLLAVPAAKGFGPFGLRLPKGIAKHIEELVGVRSGQAAHKLVAVLHQFGVVPVLIGR